MSSIATRTGDGGTTGLMFDRRLPKTHVVIEVAGCVDELSAHLTLARSMSSDSTLQKLIYEVQQDLVALMGELAVAPEDWERYLAAGYSHMTRERVERLDAEIARLEGQGIVFRDWNLLGFSPGDAQLEVCRTLCRRAERTYWQLPEEWLRHQALSGQYLNRLADFLWLLARREIGRKDRGEDAPIGV